MDQEEVELRQLREQGYRGEGLFLRGWCETHPGVDDAQLLQTWTLGPQDFHVDVEVNSFNLERGKLRSNHSVQLSQNGRVTQATNFQRTHPGKVGVLTKGEQTYLDLTLPNLTV